MKKVWIVDDDSSIRWVLARAMRSEGYEVSDFENAGTVLHALKKNHPDVLITDIRMPGMDGLELARSVRKDHAQLPCIVMTAHTDLDSALASYESGAFEYLPKPFDLDDAVRLVRRALEPKDEQSVKRQLEDATDMELIGEAPAMQDVFRAIGRLAKSNINVLLQGQSGTGKAVVAKALHQNSPRVAAPFVALNIAAIPGELLAVELFGSEAPGGERIEGKIEQAQGGTLFLDEISEMSVDGQSRLLRVLTDSLFYRVGGQNPLESDVRLLASSSKDIEKLVASGDFREDLYHRLKVIQIELPSLTDRAEDIPLLSKRFLQVSAAQLGVEMKILSEPALVKMMAYEWPGNVLELENMCRWLTVMSPARIVSEDDLPKELLHINVDEQPRDWEIALAKLVRQKLDRGQREVSEDLVRRFEATLLKVALAHSGGHRQNAAKLLGWGRNTLTRKLKDLNLS